MENHVEILWVGWGMLRLPIGELNLAPHLPHPLAPSPQRGEGGQGVRALGGPLRKSLVASLALALAACSRPTGPIAVGLAGPFSQPRGASMLRAAQLAVNQINAKRG